jgi:hypothetical protein
VAETNDLDELEPISNQEEAKIRTLELELVDEAEDLLYIAAAVDVRRRPWT